MLRIRPPSLRKTTSTAAVRAADALPPVPAAGARVAGHREPTADSSVYDGRFWLTYAANTSLMVAVSLLFRYADFVMYLGGTEFQLGLIVGCGMIGSLLMRLAQGVGIDRYGPRQVWLLSLATLVVCLVAHLFVSQVDTPLVYGLQVVFRTGVAGAFGASITSVFQRVPVRRMAEAVGSLGTSGFVGMIVGPMIGDLLLGSESISRQNLNGMFLLAALLCLISLVAAWLATRVSHRRVRRQTPPLYWLLRRYHPGPMLLMGVAMGFGLGLPGVFLRTYAAQLGIAQIALYFVVYATLAFSTRVATRRMPERIGNQRMIFYGMVSLVTSMLAYLAVDAHWQLAIPAVFTGVAHALLFPAIIAGGSATFPNRYRGLATSLMLATFDAGMLVGGPLVGAILHYSEAADLPPYPTMFIAVAGLLAASEAYYAIATKQMVRVPLSPEQRAIASGAEI